MPNRRIRFAVFTRDNFTCQYCGRASPTVTLELEHINPSYGTEANGND